MGSTVYDEIEIEDMDYDEDQHLYLYACPCGDLFQISVEELRDGEDIARCPSCSLVIRVIYSAGDFDEVAGRDNAQGNEHPPVLQSVG